MSKRQAVAPSTGGPTIPSDLIAFNKQPTDAYDDFTILLPSQLTDITVTNSGVQKIKMELPNIKSLRLNQIMLECTLTPGFTSTRQ